jgi:regulator of protease activity HflC (stomatin/prohibitin superfamily)
MCFSSGPSEAEKQAAAAQRAEAEAQKQEEIRRRAEQKREDIGEAISSRTTRAGTGGGTGRRSLISSGSGAGFLGRFR